jgi:hypothetical protein
MDRYYTAWEPKLADKFEELGIDRDKATAHCESSRQQLLVCAECQPSELAKTVKNCVRDWESRVYQIMNEVTA